MFIASQSIKPAYIINQTLYLPHIKPGDRVTVNSVTELKMNKLKVQVACIALEKIVHFELLSINKFGCQC